MSPAADPDCPMTGECPAYDRDGRTCLVHPGDCEFGPADAASDLGDTPDSGAAAAPRGRGPIGEG